VADPGVGLVLAAGAGAYALGARRRADSFSRREAVLFATGWVTLAVALLPPIDSAAGHSLSVHMVQHVLLLAVAPPLLAVGAVLPTLLWALPAAWRDPVLRAWGRVSRSRVRRWVTWAVVALVAQTVVMWVWHAPGPYEAAVHHQALHAAEHVTFLVTSVAFWWALGLGSAGRDARRPGSQFHGGSVALVFAAALPGSALGAAMTLAGTPWYPSYPSLADQQTAGVVMWGFAGLAYVVTAAVLFGVWLSGMERETPGNPVLPPGVRRARAEVVR
jgi:putative membrane protein